MTKCIHGDNGYDDDDVSVTYQLIDGGGCGGLLGFAGDQGVLHVSRHVQLEREGEVSVHLDDCLHVDDDEDDGDEVDVHLLFHHGDHVEAVAHRVESQNVWQRLKACSFFRSHLRNESSATEREQNYV